MKKTVLILALLSAFTVSAKAASINNLQGVSLAQFWTTVIQHVPSFQKSQQSVEHNLAQDEWQADNIEWFIDNGWI